MVERVDKRPIRDVVKGDFPCFIVLKELEGIPGRFPNHLLSLVKPWLSGILSGEGDWQPGDRKT